MDEKDIYSMFKIGVTVRINHLMGEDDRYDGVEGEVTYVDDIGQVHGTWCSLAIIPDVDDYEILD